MRRLAFHETMGVLGVGDLHPGGRAATDFLLAEVARSHPDLVLEVGAGIGLTTARMARLGWRVEAIEPNEVLRRALAKQHVKIYFEKLEAFKPPARPYDAVIAESVLYAMELPSAFAKLYGLLRPGGVLGFVDLLWTEAADPQVVAAIHDETQCTFGIPMASRQRHTWTDWKRMLREVGFELVAEREAREPQAPARPARIDLVGRLGQLLSGLRHPLALGQRLNYRRLSRRPRVPAAWLETRAAVWQRPLSPA
jgi:SAM-dependent methyltransferase